MTNKDYKRLTTWNEELQRPCMSADSSNEQTVDIVARHVDRLFELENAIENGTLVFLPCKVGQKFWWISGWNFQEIIEQKVSAIRVENLRFVIYDEDDTRWLLGEIYFTKEAAEKALEEMKK
jgi:hypothetical protein|nr:MAG TPA: protein of unknown function (DUF1508) [Caudoviricetes sp.]